MLTSSQNGQRIGKGGRILGEPKPPRKGVKKANTVNVDKIQDVLLPAVQPGPPSPYGDEYPPGEVHEREELQRLQRLPPLQRSHHHRGRHPRQDPKRGIRLDDRTVALVLRLIDCPKSLNEWWPGEFDVNGMPKAERIPLGHAAKKWVSARDVDSDGNVATEADEGYYYLWWKGLQVLMGKEGHDAGLYMVRPSWELDEQTGFSFKLTHRAVVQALL
ncbi:MAG: hypothetical protein Q9193_001841 [Seirophora villosa]